MKKLVDDFYVINRKRIEKIVSFGLQEVFSDRLLRITTEVANRRGKTHLDIFTVDDEHGVKGKTERSFGDSILWVESFLLLATFIVLLKRKPVCFLDEKFKAVANDYQASVGKMISNLCKELGLTVCLITHNPEILEYADRIYKATLEDGNKLLLKEQ